jgi:hypothetical protein
LKQRFGRSERQSTKGKITTLKTILIGLLFLVLAVGCKKGDSGNIGNTSSSDIFPNKIGDTWHYLVKDTIIQGSQDGGAVSYNVDVVIVDTIKWSPGVTASIWQYHYPAWTDSNYVFQSGDTIKFMDRTKSLLVKQYIIPFTSGLSWPYVPGFDNVSVTGQAAITVGNNTFADASQIYGGAGMPDASFMIDEWFEDHVGFVKNYFNPSGELLYTKHILDWSLLSYELK